MPIGQRVFIKWWSYPGSNWGPPARQAGALPLSYNSNQRYCNSFLKIIQIKTVYLEILLKGVIKPPLMTKTSLDTIIASGL